MYSISLNNLSQQCNKTRSKKQTRSRLQSKVNVWERIAMRATIFTIVATNVAIIGLYQYVLDDNIEKSKKALEKNIQELREEMRNDIQELNQEMRNDILQKLRQDQGGP